MLMFKGLVNWIFKLAFFAAVFLIPAGTWRRPRALQFLVAYGALSFLVIIALAIWAPASLEARIQKGAAKDQPAADKVASALLALLNLAWFIFIAVEANRLHLLPKPPLWLAVAGAGIWFAGFGIITTAVRQNAFAAPIVGDQTERDQVLIDTGLYRVVRHPLYVGWFFAFWLHEP